MNRRASGSATALAKAISGIFLLVPVGANASEVDPIPAGAQIGSVDLSGADCSRSPEPVITDDKMMVATYFEGMVAEFPGDETGSSRRTCEIRLQVVRPAGYTYAVPGWSGLGSVDVMGPAVARIRNDVSFSADEPIGMRQVEFRRQSGFVSFQVEIARRVLAPCSKSGDIMVIKVMADALAMGPLPSSAYLSVGQFKFDIRKFDWVRC